MLQPDFKLTQELHSRNRAAHAKLIQHDVPKTQECNRPKGLEEFQPPDTAEGGWIPFAAFWKECIPKPSHLETRAFHRHVLRTLSEKAVVTEQDLSTDKKDKSSVEAL
jgi:hypothetical protein